MERRVEPHAGAPLGALHVAGRRDHPLAREGGRDRVVVHVNERVAGVEEDRADRHGAPRTVNANSASTTWPSTERTRYLTT